MIDRTLEFPPDFVWGSATSAHQVEGENRHNDWWTHEHAADTNAAEPSGIACDHYLRFAEDFRLLQSLGQRAHRLSIEWSRIEPSEGEILKSEVEHYRVVLSTLRELEIEPWVTLHHFTLPLWLAQRGGFSRRQNIDAFERFAALAGREYGDLIRYWCTINEPTIHAEMGFRFGYFPPRLQDESLCVETLANLFRAHARAAEALRANARIAPEIGITLALQAHEPYRPEAEEDRLYAARREAETNGVCCEALRSGVFRYPGRDAQEIPGLQSSSTFAGVQYYSRVRYDGRSRGLAPPDFDHALTQMGWEIYPEGLPPVLRQAASTGLPLYVTENGVAHDDDRVRVEYIADHLDAVFRARREGTDVRGYFYWSAMDNFEWNFGYAPKFGLVEVDRTTLERRPRPSAHFFGEIARGSALTPEFLSRFAVR
jgi:beta-glucosidase